MSGTAEIRAWQVVGRDAELARIEDFLDSDPHALLIEGGPGIGKTTLWEEGITRARTRGFRTLHARPSDAAAQLPLMAVADLLDEVEVAALTGVPALQQHALEVALLRAEPAAHPPEPRAIALGLLSTLRSLAAGGPLLVCVDDVQWLDDASSDALAFAARRVEDRSVRFLLARRSGQVSPALETAVEKHGLVRLRVEPMTLGAVRRMLFERLGLSLPRRTLRSLFEVAGGSPLFALELGRTLAERPPLGPGEDIPVPDAVEDLLGTRVAGLAPPVRRLLLALALNADLSTSQLAQVAGAQAVEEGLAAGLALVEGHRVRASHPLVAAAAKERARADELRDLHRALANAVDDPELRARHLALAADEPDAVLALTLESAAARASSRGAALDAADLAGHALRLTPAGSRERAGRVLALAEALDVAGRSEALTELLTRELPTMPGPVRARAHLLLAAIAPDGDVHLHHLDQALEETRGDPALRAQVLAAKAELVAGIEVTRTDDAEVWALEALPDATRAGPQDERRVLYALALVRTLRGKPVDDLRQRYNEASDAPFELHGSLNRIAAIRQGWRGETHEALAEFERLASLADERGELVSYIALRLQICELLLRIGQPDRAARLLDEWEEEGSEEGIVEEQIYARCRAVHAAVAGLPQEAERWAAQAIAKTEESRLRWDLLEALRARGVAAVLAHEPIAAVESLRTVWAHAEREGIEEPGVFPVAPDLVEALLELGELQEAAAVTARLAGLAEEQEHPWGRATAHRCDALLRLASTYDDSAATQLEQAALAYEGLGFLFDRARTVLSLGRAQRRHKKWGAARGSLEQAAKAFDEIGSPGWAEEARAELGRISGRKPRPSGELTPSERRVVELAVEGLSNKEIAKELVITVHTVERHLSHAYAKLGVRSRGQLARRLAG